MDQQGLDELFSLDGRVAIITGGSRGIGRAIAEGYSLAGARVVISSRKAAACDEAAAAINDSGGTALAIPAHMGNIEDLETLVERTVDEFGGIDIVVNNAANALAQPLGELTPEAFDKSLNTNLRGPMFLTQLALPQLRESDHASVINIASAAAYLFSFGMHLYASGKAGLLAFTRSAAAELVGTGIRVNAIAPGTIDTDMVRANAPEIQQTMAEAALMGRAAHPDELLGIALYLASDASSFTTGATFSVDGGMVPR